MNDLITQLQDPRRRKEAALKLGYQRVAELLQSPEPTRSAAILALAYFPEGKKRLADLLGTEPVSDTVVQALREAGARPSELLAHPNPTTRFRGARYLVPSLSLPKDESEVLAVMRLATRTDQETATQVMSGLTGVVQGKVSAAVLNALAELIEAWADTLGQDMVFWVHRISAMAQHPSLRPHAFKALGRLAQMRNRVGNVAIERLMDWAKIDQAAARHIK